MALRVVSIADFDSVPLNGELADFVLFTLGSRLLKEEQGGNWLYSIDGLAPLEI